METTESLLPTLAERRAGRGLSRDLVAVDETAQPRPSSPRAEDEQPRPDGVR